jgi:hypothetical protein
MEAVPLPAAASVSIAAERPAGRELVSGRAVAQQVVAGRVMNTLALPSVGNGYSESPDEVTAA